MNNNIIFFTLLFFSLNLCAQRDKVDLTIIGGTSLSYHIFITPELVYKKSKQRDNAVTIPLSDLPNGILPIYEKEFAKIRLTIELPKENSAIILERKEEIQFTVQTTGAFSTNSPEYKFDLKRDEYRNSFEIDIVGNTEGWGSGKITLSFSSLGNNAFAANTTAYELTYYELTYLLTLVNRSNTVKERARVYEYYKHFLNNSNYDKAKGGIEVKRELNNFKSNVDDSFNKLNSSDNLVNLFQVFGQPALRSYSLTGEYFQKTHELMAKAERQFFEKQNNTKDILAIESELGDYQKAFCIKGYNCQFEDEFRDRIEDFIADWKSKGSDCTLWLEIQKSRYYDKNKNQSAFLEAKSKCAECDCACLEKGLIKSYSNKGALTSLSGRSKEKNCADLSKKIDDRINVLGCKINLDNAKREMDLKEKRSLLKTIIASACDPAIVREAKEMLGLIEPLEIDAAKDKGPVMGNNPITGGRTLTYTIYFKSGKDIVIATIDNQPIDPSKAQVAWVTRDRELKITVEDKEKYDLVFESAETGDKQPYQLSKQQFAAEVKLEDDFIFTSITTPGSMPYFARFVDEKTKNSFTVKLKSPLDTLDIASLGENYQGNYELFILDNNGKNGIKESKKLPLIRGFQWQLWMVLLLPLLVLIGFIIYRNLSPQES